MRTYPPVESFRDASGMSTHRCAPAAPACSSPALTPGETAGTSICIFPSFSLLFFAAFALTFARLTEGFLHALTWFVGPWCFDAWARVRGRPMPSIRGLGAGSELGALDDAGPAGAVAVFSLFDVLRILLVRNV